MWKKVLIGGAGALIGATVYIRSRFRTAHEGILPLHCIAYKELQDSYRKQTEAFNEINTGLQAKFPVHFENNTMGGYAIYYDQSLNVRDQSKYRTAIGVYISDSIAHSPELKEALAKAGLKIAKVGPVQVLEINRETHKHKQFNPLSLLMYSWFLMKKYYDMYAAKIRTIDDALPPVGRIMFKNNTRTFIPVPEHIKELPAPTFPKPRLSRLERRQLKKMIGKIT